MIKPRFWDEEPETAFQYLIKENPLIKDSQTAQEVLETLFDKVTFLKKIVPKLVYLVLKMNHLKLLNIFYLKFTLD
jgi:hypothetical protein